MAIRKKTSLQESHPAKTPHEPQESYPRKASHLSDESSASKPSQQTETAHTSKQNTFYGFFCRLFWLSFGNLGPLISASYIMKNKEGFFSIADIFYGISILLLIAARFVDINYLDGKTDKGEPATKQHFVKYVQKIVAVFILLWIIAHFVKI